MAVGHEIRNEISSISSTRKITSAMEMVAASKMRRAQEAMMLGKPYARHIRALMSHIAAGNLEYQHVYFEEREPKKVGYIVVSSDRGLCGGLNINLFRQALQNMAQLQKRSVKISMCLIGSKGADFFKSMGADVSATVRNVGEQPKISDLIGVVRVMLEQFEARELDRVFLASNSFANAMTQTPNIAQLLPLVPDSENTEAHHWDYLYEPDDARALLSGLLTRYVESLVYQAVVENAACEQSARMIAMKNATENAGDLIKDLQLVYNKKRQAAITQELSEIVSGAAAV
jgi:F-type H+-transporting ATPase subunit gamma